MRERSGLFDELFNDREAIFEYKIDVITDIKNPIVLYTIKNENLVGKTTWVDGLSDKEECCVGNCYIGSLEFSVKNSDNLPKLWDNLRAYFRLNNKIKQSEWILIGTYHVVEKTKDHKANSVKYSCMDNMEYLDGVSFLSIIPLSETNRIISYKDTMEEIKAAADVQITNIDDDFMLLYVRWIQELESMTVRDVLSTILATTGYNARCTPSGSVKFYSPKSIGEEFDVTCQEWDYYEPSDEELPITGVRIISGEEVYEFHSTEEAGITVEITCPWAVESMAYILWKRINGYVNVPVILDNSVVNPCIEPNDIVKGEITGEKYLITNIVYNGGADLRCDLANGQWSQFSQTGSLSSIVNRGSQKKTQNYNDNIEIAIFTVSLDTEIRSTLRITYEEQFPAITLEDNEVDVATNSMNVFVGYDYPVVINKAIQENILSLTISDEDIDISICNYANALVEKE